ncbi:MAG TPA: VOC family protein [Microterricola sp.]
MTVADLAASRAFYEALGFEHVMGDQEENWLILRNGATTIGLFQGMFEGNLLTFNPGWTPNAEPLDEFEDVRSLQKTLKAEGLDFLAEVDETTSGPGSFMLRDPDGNVILFDQHVG